MEAASVPSRRRKLSAKKTGGGQDLIGGYGAIIDQYTSGNRPRPQCVPDCIPIAALNPPHGVCRRGGCQL